MSNQNENTETVVKLTAVLRKVLEVQADGGGEMRQEAEALAEAQRLGFEYVESYELWEALDHEWPDAEGLDLYKTARLVLGEDPVFSLTFEVKLGWDEREPTRSFEVAGPVTEVQAKQVEALVGDMIAFAARDRSYEIEFKRTPFGATVGKSDADG